MRYRYHCERLFVLLLPYSSKQSPTNLQESLRPIWRLERALLILYLSTETPSETIELEHGGLQFFFTRKTIGVNKFESVKSESRKYESKKYACRLQEGNPHLRPNAKEWPI